jgi:hypothetical protein
VEKRQVRLCCLWKTSEVVLCGEEDELNCGVSGSRVRSCCGGDTRPIGLFERRVRLCWVGKTRQIVLGGKDE